ncbi:MAG: 16S rRNA (cytosine(1402)-N(4))-methyltransferase RsmH [Burkholderiales bacterium]|nr:16S rRNA (cytosine(1402)-N(4))-methyltransferase RsmH [Burkholderiales bacterium]
MINKNTESVHKTVLLKETIEGLNLNKDQSLVIDATFGGGGHSKEILEEYKNAKIIAFDQDKGAWDRAKDKFKGLEKRITFLNLNFREINSKEKVDGIIFDLGLSSDQLENSGRGFSFMKDEPLLMTMKENPLPEDLTAMDIVNNWGEENLADIIYGYGEERFSRRIAKAIVEFRKNEEINSTFTLVKIIENSVPGAYKKGRIHCATKTFQALRIAVNDELGALEEGLNKGFEVLKNGGRMSVISFHSLEDRVVKRFFKKLEKDKKAILVNKKIITATNEEIKNNPRSRSAKLRILEKI